jgi:thiamine pyrophosphate-dependent acetolactate synthase large subunit-like protein
MTFARYRLRNVLILVFENRAYVTTGSIPTATAGVADLVAMARGAGIEHAWRAKDAATFEHYMQRAVVEDGPFFIVADVEQEDMASVGKSSAMPFDIVESSIRFRRTLEERGLVPPIWAV